MSRTICDKRCKRNVSHLNCEKRIFPETFIFRIKMAFEQFAEVCFRVTCRYINNLEIYFFDFNLKKCISHNYKYIKHLFLKIYVFSLKTFERNLVSKNYKALQL